MSYLRDVVVYLFFIFTLLSFLLMMHELFFLS